MRTEYSLEFLALRSTAQLRKIFEEHLNLARGLQGSDQPSHPLPNVGPHDLPPWEAVYQQTRRWLSAGVFEAMVHDLRVLLRLSEGRAPDPTAAILDSRTLRSTPESGPRGGYDGHKGKKGSKVHAAVDTLGHLLALLRVSPAKEDDRQEVRKLSEEIQRATGENVRSFPGSLGTENSARVRRRSASDRAGLGSVMPSPIYPV